jgi:hypothetical protein
MFSYTFVFQHLIKGNSKIYYIFRVVLDSTLFDSLPVALRQVGGFLGVLRFPPPIKLTSTKRRTRIIVHVYCTDILLDVFKKWLSSLEPSCMLKNNNRLNVGIQKYTKTLHWYKYVMFNHVLPYLSGFRYFRLCPLIDIYLLLLYHH